MKLFKVETIKHNMFTEATFDCYVVAEDRDDAGQKALRQMKVLCNEAAEDVLEVRLIADEETNKDGWLLIK